ncbi:hypothetical protein BESB_013950 [Besnoitia besnoiti]|uniref:Uncharacterized protein n=1 Tax=Besnoitia besnoiti TaxID=94643 RepID=A0A2A9MAS1_BESBE|nr:hypothetical protein BESB_013950 [Besnoitia besnoiti]PFH32783.1 hypothetical protein BESB_013950 [Besnoitia besnoiti]
MIVLRLRTTIGWVSMRRLSQDGREREIQLEKVDEAEEIFKTPQLYQVIADGYLLNVRQGLEIEGPVVRTLPPATQVEVFERRMNNEGLMRLRLSDGWISERRRDPDTPVHTFTSALAKRFSASLFGASSFSSCGAGVGGSGADAGGRGGSVVPTGTGRLFAVRVRDTREITRKRQLLAALAADGARQRWRESHSPWCRVNSLFQVEEVGEGIGELCEIRIPRNLTCGGCENSAGLDSRTLPRRNNGDRFADKIGSHRAEPTEESQSSGYGNSSEHGTWGRRSALVSGYKRFCNHVTPDTAGCCSPRQEEPAVRQRTLKSSKAHISVDRKRQMASHDRSTHRSIGEKRSASDECRRDMRCCTKYPGKPEACGRILATSLSSQGRRSWSRAEKRGIACPCSLVAGDGAPGFQPHDDVMASTTSQSLRGSYIDFGEGSCNILDVCFQDASCAETAPDSNRFSSVTRRVAPMQAYSKCAISNGATGCGQSLIVTDNERDGPVLHGLCYTPIQPYAARDSADTLASAFVVNSVQDSVRGEQLPEAQRNLETACTGRQHGERTQRSKNILLNGRSRGSGDVESLPVVPVASDDPGVQLGNRGWEVTQGTDTERRAMLCGRCHWTVPVAGLSTVSGETQFGWDPREMKENGGGDANCSPQQERTNGSQSSHAHGGVWHTDDDGAVNSSSSLAQALRTLFSPLAFISLSGRIHRTPNTRVAVVAGMNITRSGDSGHCHGMRRQEHAGLPHHNLRTYKSQIGIQTDCRIGESERIVGVVNGGTPLASDTVRVVDGTEGFLERPNDTGKRSLFASEVSEIFGGCAGISDAEEEVPFGLCAWAGSGVGSPAENPIFRDGSVRAMTTRVIGPAPRDRFCHNTGNRLAAEAAFNFLSGAGTRRRLQSVGGSRTTPAVSLTRAFFDHEDTTSSPHGMRHPSQRRCRSCASHAALPCPSGGSGDVTSRLEASDVVAGEDADDNNRTTPSGAAVGNRQDCCRSAARSLREPTETQASCGTRNYGEHPYTYTDSCDSRPVTAERRLHGPARIRRTAREESDIGGGASQEEPSTSEEREDTPRGSVEAHGGISISCQDDGRLAGSGDATGDAGAWAERALTGVSHFDRHAWHERLSLIACGGESCGTIRAGIPTHCRALIGCGCAKGTSIFCRVVRGDPLRSNETSTHTCASRTQLERA